MQDSNPRPTRQRIPPRRRIPLYCAQPLQAEHNHEAEELRHFPPVRVGDSPPLLASTPGSAPSRVRAAQQTTYDSEDELELSDFPPIRIGNDPPIFASFPTRLRSRPPPASRRGSQQRPSPSQAEASQSRHRQKPSPALGTNNVVNTMNLTAAAKARSTLKRDFEFGDTGDKRPSKKQRAAFPSEDDIGSVQDEIASLKKAVGQMAADIRDMKNTLHKLCQEVRRNQ